MFGYIDTRIDRVGGTALVWKNIARLFWLEMARTRISPCPSPRFSHCSLNSSTRTDASVASQFWGFFVGDGAGMTCHVRPPRVSSHCSHNPGELIPWVASRFWGFSLQMARTGDTTSSVPQGFHIVLPTPEELIPWVASQLWAFFAGDGAGMYRVRPPRLSHCSLSPGELIPRVASRSYFFSWWLGSRASHSSLNSQWRADASDCLSTDFGFWEVRWNELHIVSPGVGKLVPWIVSR